MRDDERTVRRGGRDARLRPGPTRRLPAAEHEHQGQGDAHAAQAAARDVQEGAVVRRLLAAVALLAFTACAHWPVNPQLATADIAHGYRYSNVVKPADDDLFVVLTFSGG